MSERENNKRRKDNDGNEEKKSCQMQTIQYTIEILNYECLEEIFSYLCTKDRLNLEKLSKKLKDASSFAWRRVTELTMKIHPELQNDKLRIKKHSIEDYQHQIIARQVLKRCGNHLEILSLRYRFDSLMDLIAEKFHNLRKLTIGFVRYYNTNFDDTFKNLKNLKYLEISHFVLWNFNILKSLPEGIEEISIIKHIRIARMDASEDFENFANKWKSLRSLKLSRFDIRKNVNIIFNENNPLTHLSLEKCRFTDLDETISAIVKYKNLEHLNLTSSDSVDSSLIISIANNLKNLKSLDIHECVRISNRALEELGKLKNLEEINFSNTQADDDVLAKFKNLKSLSCKVTEVSDTGVIAILDSSPNLEYLNVLQTRITANILSHASNLTNYREKKLVINVHNHVIESFKKRKEISSFLELKNIAK